MLIYNPHSENAPTVECLHMMNKFAFTFLWSHVDHMLLLATVNCTSTLMNALCALSLLVVLNSLKNKWHTLWEVTRLHHGIRL